MIQILRANDLITDSRIQKYIQYFDVNQVSYRILGWDRHGKCVETDIVKYYKRKSDYNLGKKAMVGRLYWMCFVLYYLILNRKKFTVIHACDFDAALPAVIFGLIFRKKVVFDVFDWFGDTIQINIKWVTILIQIFENFTAKMSSAVIVCEAERARQMKVKPQKLFVLPNIPTIDPVKHEIEINSSRISLSYVGGFYKDRNIELLLEVIQDYPKIELHIAGYGDRLIEQLCQEKAEQSDNVIFYGRVPYDKALGIMNATDLIYAMYCKANKNHIFAAPNKFYESLMLAKPIITTSGTIVGEKVDLFKTGFVIDEAEIDLRNLLSQLSNMDRSVFEKISKRCAKIWLDEYSEFVERFFRNEYLPFIRSVNK